MTWNPSIKLAVAQHIFPRLDIQPHEISGKVAYYSASLNGDRIEDQGLTNLCKRIVEILMEQ
jgi:hypothetical protein